MSRALDARLQKLERQHRSWAAPGKWHRIIGDTDEELAEKRDALMASSAWTEGDGIIERLIVDPPQRG